MAAALLALGSLLVSAPCAAQTIERHLPALPPGPQPALPAPAPPALSTDARRLGPDLAGIVVLDASADVAGGAQRGGVSFVGASRLDDRAGRRLLSRFLGRPLTLKLIGDIEAAVVRRYRALGHPLVAVSTPEQELTRGLLRLRVIEFTLGRVDVAGVSPRKARDLRKAIRAAVGEPVDGGQLLQDLDWLGRYPYRTVQPAFSPGADLGETDLTLSVRELRPWRAYAGYANSGSAETSFDRVFVGGDLGGPLGSVLSAQITGSPDFWEGSARLFPTWHARYESTATRLWAPVAPRTALEGSFDAVETNSTDQVFAVRQQTLEGSLLLRTAVSNVLPLGGDVAVGAEVRREIRKTYFAGVQVLGGSVDIYQLVTDWRDGWTDASGHTAIDIAVRVSPGGLDGKNSDAAFTAFTFGRARHAEYAYASFSIQRQTRLPLGLVLSNELVGQYAQGALPDTEQMAIGGPGAIRGFTLDDGAFDDALLLRSELRAAPWNLQINPAGPPIAVDPLVLLDTGVARNTGTPTSVRLTSIGIGATIALPPSISASLSVARPMETTRATRAGAWRLDARIGVAL